MRCHLQLFIKKGKRWKIFHHILKTKNENANMTPAHYQVVMMVMMVSCEMDKMVSCEMNLCSLNHLTWLFSFLHTWRNTVENSFTKPRWWDGKLWDEIFMISYLSHNLTSHLIIISLDFFPSSILEGTQLKIHSPNLDEMVDEMGDDEMIS